MIVSGCMERNGEKKRSEKMTRHVAPNFVPRENAPDGAAECNKNVVERCGCRGAKNAADVAERLQVLQHAVLENVVRNAARYYGL